MNYTVIWVDEGLCLLMDHVAATCVDAAIRAAAGEHGREVLDLGDTIVLEGWHDDLTPRCSACGDVLIGGDCPCCVIFGCSPQHDHFSGSCPTCGQRCHCRQETPHA